MNVKKVMMVVNSNVSIHQGHSPVHATSVLQSPITRPVKVHQQYRMYLYLN